MPKERVVFLMRINPSQHPAAGGVMKLGVPPLLEVEMDRDGWQVVSHAMTAVDLEGTLMLTLYAERNIPLVT